MARLSKLIAGGVLDRFGGHLVRTSFQYDKLNRVPDSNCIRFLHPHAWELLFNESATGCYHGELHRVGRHLRLRRDRTPDKPDSQS